MTVQKYRKKPVEIEAMRFEDLGAAGLNQQKAYEVASWIAGHDDDEADDFPEYASNAIWIETLEGTMVASLGDWVIRGVQGEFYPCKPDIFDATYEAVGAEPNRGSWVRRGELPPVGSKLVAGNTGKVVYEVIEHGEGFRRDRVRLRDTRNGRSVGWEIPRYYRYVIEENNA